MSLPLCPRWRNKMSLFIYRIPHVQSDKASDAYCLYALCKGRHVVMYALCAE